MQRVGVLLSALGLVLVTVGAAAQDTKIGVTAVVNPNATGQPPSQPRRTLLVGSDVFSRENVVTTENGQAQMLFLDESALTIGPNSEVVLDEFVYDPNTKTGTLALTATKGLFRLVGGRISKTNPVKLKTPTATIGIRGGIAMVNAVEGGGTTSTFLFGDRMDVTSGGVTKSATRPGFTISVSAPNLPPSDPVVANPAQLSGALSSLEGSSEPAGGGENTPTRQKVAASGVANQGSNNQPNALGAGAGRSQSPATARRQAAASRRAEGAAQKNQMSRQTAIGNLGSGTTSGLSGVYKHQRLPTASNLGSADNNSNFTIAFSDGSISSNSFSVELASSLTFQVPSSSGTELALTSSGTDSPFGQLTGFSEIFGSNEFVILEAAEVSFSDHKIFAFAGAATAESSLPTSGATFGALLNDYLLSSNLFGMRSSSAGALTASIAETTADTAFYWDTSGSSTANRVWGHYTVAVSGTGTSQQSAISMMGGRILTGAGGTSTADGSFLLGEMRGSSRTGPADSNSFFFEGPVSSTFDKNDKSFFGSSGGYAALESVETTFGGVKSFTDPNIAESNIGASVIDISPNAVVIPATDTLSTRTSRTMNGFIAGAVQSVNFIGTSSGAVSLTRLFRPQNVTAPGAPDSVTVKTSAASNKVQANFTGEVNIFSGEGTVGTKFSLNFGDNDVTAFGDEVTTAGNSAFIDDEKFGAIEKSTGSQLIGDPPSALTIATQAKLYMVRVDNDTISSIIGSTNLCSQCSFSSWGFWGGDITENTSESERIHMATWVAGQNFLASELSSVTGTATYTGKAIGTVQLSSLPNAPYLASGQYLATINFGSPSSSTVAINNFDGVSYSGSGVSFLSSSPGGFRTYSGSISNGGLRSGSVLGSFVKNATSTGLNTAGVPPETIGHFQIEESGGAYKASGTFAAATP